MSQTKIIKKTNKKRKYDSGDECDSGDEIDFYKKSKIDVDLKKLKRLQNKYDPSRELDVEIRKKILDEFPKSELYKTFIHSLKCKMYYEELNIKKDEDKINNKCIVEYKEPLDENLCSLKEDLVDHIDKIINDNKSTEITECQVSDDIGLIIETYSPDSEIVIVEDTQQKTHKNTVGDKTIKYYLLIMEKSFENNNIVKIKYY